MLVGQAYSHVNPPPVVNPGFFIPAAKLPYGLKTNHIESALNETHRIVRLINATLRQASGRPLSAYFQGNNFSGIVSNILTDSFSRLTPYKHNHAQKYPDLICVGKRGKASTGLEVKTTIQKGKGGESHNGHSGWHVVACFALDADSGDIRFVHVMFANLVGHGNPDADWKYVGSSVNKDTGSQRTETYNTTASGTTKLRHGTVYLDTDIVNITRWKIDLSIPVPKHSPFIAKTM